MLRGQVGQGQQCFGVKLRGFMGVRLWVRGGNFSAKDDAFESFQFFDVELVKLWPFGSLLLYSTKVNIIIGNHLGVHDSYLPSFYIENLNLASDRRIIICLGGVPFVGLSLKPIPLARTPRFPAHLV